MVPVTVLLPDQGEWHHQIGGGPLLLIFIPVTVGPFARIPIFHIRPDPTWDLTYCQARVGLNHFKSTEYLGIGMLSLGGCLQIKGIFLSLFSSSVLCGNRSSHLPSCILGMLDVCYSSYSRHGVIHCRCLYRHRYVLNVVPFPLYQKV